MTEDADPPTSGPEPGAGDRDRLAAAATNDDLAVARLEDVLQGLPYDRALPPLDVLLVRAEVPAELLRRDDRVLKVLHEAIVARPFGQLADVTRARTEIELLTLEVELLTDRLADRQAAPDVVTQATTRLAEVRGRLREVRAQL